MAIMTEHVPADCPIHLHCFWGDTSTTNELFKAFPKAVIGISNNVFYSPGEPEELSRCVPLERIVLETDAPYLPRPGTRMSHMGDIPPIGRRIAELREDSF